MPCQHLIGTFNDLLPLQFRWRQIYCRLPVKLDGPAGAPLDGRLRKRHCSSPLLSVDLWAKWYAVNCSAKQLRHELYPNSIVEFRFSRGWFHRFLIRNAITLCITTNKAQETPEEYFVSLRSLSWLDRQRSSSFPAYFVGLSSALQV